MNAYVFEYLSSDNAILMACGIISTRRFRAPDIQDVSDADASFAGTILST